MGLSVIVTSYESPETLELCLESLAAQREASEIVVSDCSRENPARVLRDRFPAVRFLHFPELRSVPQLRWAALPFTSEEFIAATEARCIPSPNWCSDLLSAHALAPENPAVGGTVEVATPCSAFEYALYLCEYGAYTPPVPEGPATAISGANLSYRRTRLEECRDLTDRGEWETLLHRRWVEAGQQLWQCAACVTFRNSMSIRQALRQRWSYGRGYAADRVRGLHWPVRLVMAAASFGLPFLLLARIARQNSRRATLISFARASGWVLALSIAWSLGETAGYSTGKPARTRIF